MKRTKEFFGVLISVLVCVFVVFLGVYAATTVGTDISIEDDLTVTGNTITFGNGTTIDNSAAAGILVITEDQIDIVGYATISSDLLLEGDLYLDGTASIGTGIIIGDATTGILLPSTYTTGINISGVATTDINLSDGATIINNDASTLTITEALISLSGAASVSEDLSVEGGNFSVSGTMTASDVLTFSDGGTIDNSDANTLQLTETNIDLVGALAADALTVSDVLTFSDGGTIDNSDATTLTVTETLISLSGAASVSEDLSVIGGFSVDGTVSVSDANGIEVGGGITLTAGTASPSADCTVGSWYFRAGQSVSASIHYCEVANEWDVAGFLAD